MNFRWNTGRFPPRTRLISCQLAWQLSRLQDGSGLNLWFFLTFFFFFSKLEGKGLGRNTHWLCLAFSDCSELGILIIRTSHSPVPWFLMWETFSSLPENLLRLNCPGSKIFFIPHWASFLSIFGTPSDASIVSSSLFSKTPNCIAVSLY